MNDSTGPMSGYSIAEFPIDVTALAYAYADLLKTLNTNEITLEQFLKLVIDSQFTDIRAIGYGKNRHYKPMVPGKSEAEPAEGPDIQQLETNWSIKYGGWRPPLIDFYFETGIEYADPTSSTFKNSIRGSGKDKRLRDPSSKLIKRIHIYDRQLDPYRLLKSILTGDSDFERGEINRGKLQSYFNNIVKKLDFKQVSALREAIGKIRSETPKKQDPNAPGDPTTSRKKVDDMQLDQISAAVRDKTGVNFPSDPEIVDRPNKTSYSIPTLGNKREVVKSELMRFVPTLTLGTNGSLIRTINVGSKTDGAIGAANLFQVVKGGTGKKALSANGLEEVNNLPLRVVPIQLTMSTLGCPIAGLYQQYFIDLYTGTTIDNLYKLSQLRHTISQGKFESSWTFIYTDGYGKFGAAPTVSALAAGEFEKFLDGWINNNDPGKRNR